MTNRAIGKRVIFWMRGVGVLVASILMALTPLSQASAASAKKNTAKVAKTTKASSKTAKRPVSKNASTPKARAKKTVSTQKATRSAGRKTKSTTTAKSKGRTKTTLAAKRSSPRGASLASRKTRLSLSARNATTEAERLPRLSLGQMAGLHETADPLDLKSSVALVMDQDTNEVLFSKNDHAVLPIASITKLMTGLIVSDARLPLDESIAITAEDVDTEKGSRSRLTVGTTLTRGELMHLALMSSENRAAHALGRTYPGGMNRFVSLMNARAIMLGMKDTRYVEPTGLSSANRSSASDLATLVAAASKDALLRQLTTSTGYEVAVGDRVVQYNNTNRLVHNPEWQIGLQKTGYISEAGRCLVMQANVAGRKLIMVFLDSSGKYSRLADAERVRRWVELQHPANTVVSSHYSG
ncbi:serine hydrolase [Ottowia sp.]|uniref:serine hydrolase n=1 Tax=Ottowia sp. TaxID=1898956 RepID=UPI003A88FE66